MLAGYEFEETYVQEEDEPPSKMITDGKQKLIGRKVEGVLLGFRIASKSDYQMERCKRKDILFPFVSLGMYQFE